MVSSRSALAALRVLVTVAVVTVGVALVGARPVTADVTQLCVPEQGSLGPGGPSFRRCGVPDFDQRRVSLANSGKMYCVPTSGLDWMAYIAERGYSTVEPGPGFSTTPLTDAQDTLIDAHLLKMGLLMDTDPVDGTFNAVGGLKSWLAGAGPVGAAFGVHSVATSNMDPIVATAVQGSLTMLRVGWWKSVGDLYVRDGGHVVALVGAETAPEHGAGAYRIWINDPGSALDGNYDLNDQSPFWTDTYTTAPVSGVFAFAKGTKDHLVPSLGRRTPRS
jgi:hypothetical protein